MRINNPKNFRNNFLIESVNNKFGRSITLTAADVGASPLGHKHSWDSILNVPIKFPFINDVPNYTFTYNQVVSGVYEVTQQQLNVSNKPPVQIYAVTNNTEKLIIPTCYWVDDTLKVVLGSVFNDTIPDYYTIKFAGGTVNKVMNYVMCNPSIYDDNYGIVYYLDEMYNCFKILGNVYNMKILRLYIASVDNTVTGNISLNINSLENPGHIYNCVIPVTNTKKWIEIILPNSLEGTVIVERRYNDVTDTLKSGSSVITAKIFNIAVEELIVG